MRQVTQNGSTATRSSHGHLRVLRVAATTTAPHEAVTATAQPVAAVASTALTSRDRLVLGTAAIVAPIAMAANVLYAILGT